MTVLIERYLQKGSLPRSLDYNELKEFRETPHYVITHMFHEWSSGSRIEMAKDYVRFLNAVWYKSDTQTRLKVRKVFQETFRKLRGQNEAYRCSACKVSYSKLSEENKHQSRGRSNYFLTVKRFPRKLTEGELQEINRKNEYQVKVDEEDYEIYFTDDYPETYKMRNINLSSERKEAQEKIRRSAEESFKRRKISSLCLAALGAVGIGFTLYQVSQCVPEDESLMGQILGSIGIISRNVESGAFCSAVNWFRA